MLNRCFAEYDKKYLGQSCIVFGTGPTVDLYQNKDCLIKLGSNEIIYKPYKMDYYFIGDRGDNKRGFCSDKKAYMEYTPNIARFFRVKSKPSFACNCFNPDEIPVGAFEYQYTGRLRDNVMPSDDITSSMIAYSTISLEVMQFAVYCGFKNIFLVGMDCDYSKGSFKSPDFRSDIKTMKQVWSTIAKWLDIRGVKCYSVNRVGLTMFENATLDDIRS